MACSSGPEESLKNFVEKQKQEAPKPVNPLPLWVMSTNCSYAAEHLRSPFEPAIIPFLDKPTKDWPLSQNKAILEHHPLDSLRMVGTLMNNHQILALIRDGSGYIHSLKMQDRIGQHGGIVVSITENTVEISEWIMNDEGVYSERKVPLNLI